MGILEKLRPLPRWKHADPAVRAASVYDLGPDEAEALLALAREDAEARVRRAAVTRLDDPAVLGDIARTDPDEDVRAEAIRGLAGLAAETEEPAQAAAVVRQLVALGRMKEVVVIARAGTTADVRAAVVDLVDDPKSLGSISRHAQDSATRLRALARLADPEEVLGVALKSEHTDAAVAALERVTDAEALSAIAQRARNKVAARRARTRLRLLEEAARPAPQEATVRMKPEDRARALALLHRAEGLVVVSDPEAATAALAETRLAWAEFQADADEIDADLTQQFETASEAVREAIAERQRERAAEQERADALAREQADRVIICQQIEALSGPEAVDRIAECVQSRRSRRRNTSTSRCGPGRSRTT
jgi:DNA repair protein SbcC/Rad50